MIFAGALDSVIFLNFRAACRTKYQFFTPLAQDIRSVILKRNKTTYQKSLKLKKHCEYVTELEGAKIFRKRKL